MLRSLGIPSRYVSGYLHPNRKAAINRTVEGQSHAWIESWTGGWWGYDPTNDVPITERHVSVGVGRDYSDVTAAQGHLHRRPARRTSRSRSRSPGWPDQYRFVALKTVR